MAIDPLLKRYHPIEEYGIIGDLRTAALVGPNGSIDFLCFPRFDSPSIFCAQADADNGGRFQILPALSGVTQKRMYMPDSNVLLNRFLGREGVAEISDFMLCEEGDCPQALIRRAKAVHNDVTFHLLFQPRFDYARAQHSVEQISDFELIVTSKGADRTRLRFATNVPLTVREDGDIISEFTLRAGEKALFLLLDAEAPAPSRESFDDFCIDAFKRTDTFWHRWIGRSQYKGRWRERVNRSALALKLLTSREFGSIIAAPCFGFPNEIGGERNWDYRFTWVRDASFSTYALMRLGFTDSAGAFMQWMEQRIDELEGEQTLQTMYTIDGRPVGGEVHLDHLEGYMGSKPVRVGSTNHDQLQLDIYGELFDSIYLYDKYGEHISYDLWSKLSKLVDYVCKNWQKADSSIWEVRSEPREFLYSRVMCWVAVDRAIRLSEKRSFPAPIDSWRKVRDAIYQSVFTDFWSKKKNSFVQFKGGQSLDASTLIMPLVRFISPSDNRWRSTLDAIERGLVEDSRVYRYNVGEAFSDELEGGEGTFSICSFWYIECVARSGDIDKARYLFEKILGYSNDLGLFSEQIGSRGEFLGNIPQAFTHLAMISASFDLNRRLSEPRELY
ncbi:MAG: glycoside hydrolase family 15 protein [Bdellovibrionales bacterium]|nr:glycoside hydrolase family 15 protein [Bdellovibrionales bacterium]